MRKFKSFFRIILLTIVISLSSCAFKSAPQPEGGEIAFIESAKKPNVLLIVADDLGYTDLGVFGSEIPTPNIDSLAENGVLFSNLYAAPNCSPTRAMILSGTDNHVAGLGTMGEHIAENHQGVPGYEGYLHPRVATLAEVLKADGYNTYMTGKWHLGLDEETSPAARGFDKSFALLQGGAGHFDNMLAMLVPPKARYSKNGQALHTLPKNFYSSRFYANQLVQYIESDRSTDKPFFAYLAYTAPHWPLQAPKESIARHRGKYDAGYDKLFKQRITGLKSTNLFPKNVEPAREPLGTSKWQDLDTNEQKRQSRVMEVYAAMVEDMDIYTGQVINYLKSIGEYDNTIIVFLSDNGAEGHNVGIDGKLPPFILEHLAECCDNSLDNIGAANSYVWTGPGWTRASVGPWKLFKGFPSEGGIRVPGIFHFPKKFNPRVANEFVTVKDIMPTILELTGIEHPAPIFQDRKVVSMQGESIAKLLAGKQTLDNRQMGWELFGKMAVRKGDWKLVKHPTQDFFKPQKITPDTFAWQLYNLANDPTESNNLAASKPKVLKAMIKQWEIYAQENNIIPPVETNGY